ncbi:nuclear RNA export factor 1-like [Diretmus argenteus]
MEDGTFVAFCHFLSDLFSSISNFSLLLQKNDVILPQAVSGVESLLATIEAMAARPKPDGKLSEFLAAMKKQHQQKGGEPGRQWFKYQEVTLSKGEAAKLAEGQPISQCAPRLQRAIELTCESTVKHLKNRFSSILDNRLELLDHGVEEVNLLLQHVSTVLARYYSIYDSGDRQPLLDAYHDGASLSLMTPYSTQNPSRSSLGEYHKDSRNLKWVKDSTIWYCLLKHTRLNVVAFLNELPKTQHDTASFTVDVNTYTNTLLSFTVSGVFKEVDGKSRDSTMAFSRVFITVPSGNSGLCIVNDQIFIRMATTEEIRRAFVAPAPMPSSSPVPTLTAPQQDMLAAFSQKSGMNLEWSQKCLQDNEWDFNRAAQIFTQLKTDGKIPDVAFIK